MMYDYDEEATIQEADILQAQYEQESRELEALRRRGICTHQSWVGLPADGTIYYESQKGLKAGQVRCTDGCGQVFDSEEDRDYAAEEAMYR